MLRKFIFFWGHTQSPGEPLGKACLSQWYPCSFIADGHTFVTAEHYMMAQKALLFNDQEIYEKIVASRKPGEAKDLGRQVRGFDNAVWEEKRYGIVVQGNFYKFSQNPELADFLRKTGNRMLVEASPIDPIWGIGMAEDDKDIYNMEAWKGLNLLGIALMEVRDMITK